MEITQAEQKKKKRKNFKKEKKYFKKESLRDIWDNIKHMNIHIIDVPEGGEREKGQRNYLKQ